MTKIKLGQTINVESWSNHIFDIAEYFALFYFCSRTFCSSYFSHFYFSYYCNHKLKFPGPLSE